MLVDKIRKQVESLNYSQTKQIDIGNQKVNVSRLVLVYEIGTMRRVKENEYDLEGTIKKLTQMSIDTIEAVEDVEEENDYMDEYIKHLSGYRI